jgi:hypothetical protein
VGESENSRRKVSRVERRLLETEAGDVRVADVEMLVRELRRVVVALDELGGFEDSNSSYLREESMGGTMDPQKGGLHGDSVEGEI